MAYFDLHLGVHNFQYSEFLTTATLRFGGFLTILIGFSFWSNWVKLIFKLFFFDSSERWVSLTTPLYILWLSFWRGKKVDPFGYSPFDDAERKDNALCLRSVVILVWGDEWWGNGDVLLVPGDGQLVDKKNEMCIVHMKWKMNCALWKWYGIYVNDGVMCCHLANPNVMRTESQGLDSDCIYRRCRETYLAWSLS